MSVFSLGVLRYWPITRTQKSSAISWTFFVFSYRWKTCTRRESKIHLNPCHFVTSPFRGTPTTPFGQVGRPRCFGFLRKSRWRGCRGAEAPSLCSIVSFFESGNPSVFANDVCVSLFGSYLAEIVQVSRPVFLKLSATECVPWLHGGVFCDFCNKLEVS